MNCSITTSWKYLGYHHGKVGLKLVTKSVTYPLGCHYPCSRGSLSSEWNDPFTQQVQQLT